MIKNEIGQSDGYLEVKLHVNTRDNFRLKKLIYFTIFKVLKDSDKKKSQISFILTLITVYYT